MWGVFGDNGNVMVVISYINCLLLFFSDRCLSCLEDDISLLGNFVFYFFNIFGMGVLFIIDFYGCEEYGGLFNLLVFSGIISGFDIGFCGFDFGKFYFYVVDESCVNIYVSVNYEFENDIMWIVEFGMVRNWVEWGGVLSFFILILLIVFDYYL